MGLLRGQKKLFEIREVIGGPDCLGHVGHCPVVTNPVTNETFQNVIMFESEEQRERYFEEQRNLELEKHQQENKTLEIMLLLVDEIENLKKEIEELKKNNQ